MRRRGAENPAALPAPSVSASSRGRSGGGGAAPIAGPGSPGTPGAVADDGSATVTGLSNGPPTHLRRRLRTAVGRRMRRSRHRRPGCSRSPRTPPPTPPAPPLHPHPQDRSHPGSTSLVMTAPGAARSSTSHPRHSPAGPVHQSPCVDRRNSRYLQPRYRCWVLKYAIDGKLLHERGNGKRYPCLPR